MTHASLLFVATTLAAFLGTAATAVSAQQADEHVLGQHPAVLVKRQAPQVDTNRLILAHPAGLAIIEAPTTYDHPAVIVARRAADTSEMERRLAEPPVATAWIRRRELSASVPPSNDAH